jgi:uncharacterized protein
MKKIDLPENIPIFPLSNAVFFPRTILPLNIFEDRYIQLINDCMQTQRIFGMVQPSEKSEKKDLGVYQVGCLGKIINFNETSDNRFVINLSGIIRFKINKELETDKLYRKFNVDYSNFLGDLDVVNYKATETEKENILKKIKFFFGKINYAVEYSELVKLDFDQLVSTVCMISPFSKEEKQKLIETIKVEEKFKILDEIINFHLFDLEDNRTVQ